MVAVLEREAPPPVAAIDTRIDVQSVSHWSGSRVNPLQVLDGVDLTIQRGEFVALFGLSGYDKSTLPYPIAGLKPLTCGRVLQDDRPISESDPSHVVVFQDPMFYPWCRVWDDAALGLQAHGVLNAERDCVDNALGRVGLDGFHRVFPHELSGGMARRVALARTLANDPQLLMLDEPLGKLDSLARLAMQNELVTLWQHVHFPIMLAAHDMEEAPFLTQRVVTFSPCPTRATAGLTIDLPYPRHRDGPRSSML